MLHFNKIYTFSSPFISSASGLIHNNGRFYVISDDELNLLSIPDSLNGQVMKIRLRGGDLPEEEKERKRLKPDFESLLYLKEHDSILCIPSGSTLNRQKGALINSEHKVSEIDFSRIYGELTKMIPELNIEGAISYDTKIRLFQRGNGKLHQNGIIDLSLEDFLNDRIESIQWMPVNLGNLKDVPLSFTDAYYDKDSFWFLAVAENSESTYEDGCFVGAVLGKMNEKGEIISLEEIDIPFKPEGLYINDGEIFIVTDADNRTLPSVLYKAEKLIF
jgi:hypothetical protein